MAPLESTPPSTPNPNARIRRIESLKKAFKVTSPMGSITAPQTHTNGSHGRSDLDSPKNIVSPVSSGGTPKFYTPLSDAASEPTAKDTIYTPTKRASAMHVPSKNVQEKQGTVNKGKGVDKTPPNQATDATPATTVNQGTDATPINHSNNASPTNEAPPDEAPANISENKQHQRIKVQFISQMDMLELLPQRIHIRKIAKELCEQKAQIYELEGESAVALDGVPYLEMEYHSAKLKYNQQLEIYHEKQKIAEALLRDTANMSPMEKLTARRADLAVVEMKPDILRRAIDIEEMELVLAEKKAKSMSAEDKIAELKHRVDMNQEMLASTENDANSHIFKFSNTLPPSGLTLAGIKASLETAVKVLTERLDQVELLLESVTELEKKGDDEGDDEATNHQHRLRKTRSTLIKELDNARERNEQLIPLFLVGYHVRAKRIEELVAKKGNRKPNVQILATGCAAALDADVKADATMDIHFEGDGPNKDSKASYFKDFYHLDPNLVWKHRDFTMFIDMINMGVDMDEWRNQTPAFVLNYNKLIKEILPDFKISSDEELQAIFELDRAWGTMEATYNKIAYELRKPAILAENQKPSNAGPSSGAAGGERARSD